LFLRLQDRATPEQTAAFDRLVEQRSAGLPVAYLTGHREFMGFDFTVTPDVLVPRPETELLVEWAIDWLAQRESAEIVDIGTGSGAIAISLAAMTSLSHRITAVDLSPAALAVAQANAERLLAPEQGARLDFVQDSLLDWRIEPVDLILANLPYLTPEQIAGNPDLDAEPRLALDGGLDGLDLVRLLIERAPTLLASRGSIGLELDPSQIAAATVLLHRAFPTAHIAIIPDLAGHSRHIIMTVR
jgi:release factor glutamine methyltransferase